MLNSRASDGLRIAATVFILCCALLRPQNLDSAFSLWLAESVVKDRTVAIDHALERRGLLDPRRSTAEGYPKPSDTTAAAADGNVVDIAWKDGHFYAGRCHGLGLAVVPLYAVGVSPFLTLLPQGGLWSAASDGIAVLLLALLTSALAAALTALLVYRFHIGVGLTRRSASAATLVYSFGTIGFFHATNLGAWPLLNLMSWLILADLFAPRRPADSGRSFLHGVLGGFIITLHLIGGLIVAVLAGYLGLKGRYRRLFRFTLGVCVGSVPLLAYQAACFGSPFLTPYSFRLGHLAEIIEYGWFGFGEITFAAVRELAFSWERGVITLMPIALLGLFARIEKANRDRVLVGLAGFAVVFVANAARPLDWAAGEGFWGPRYLLPGLPFLWLVIIEGWVRLRHSMVAVLAGLSVVANTVGAQFGEFVSLPVGMALFLIQGPRFPVLDWVRDLLARHTQGGVVVSSLGLLLVTAVLLACTWTGWRKELSVQGE